MLVEGDDVDVAAIASPDEQTADPLVEAEAEVGKGDTEGAARFDIGGTGSTFLAGVVALLSAGMGEGLSICGFGDSGGSFGAPDRLFRPFVRFLGAGVEDAPIGSTVGFTSTLNFNISSKNEGRDAQTSQSATSSSSDGSSKHIM